jgi:HEAT repeat-containing protein 3
MLGILGCLLPEGLVKVITAFIVEICMQETDAWALSEAIDSLMDIFSDNDWNQIAYDLSLVAKSRELEKMLKTKVSKKSNTFWFY